MASEAQRLITLSLGKIASSKGQRGGVNLYKNLLVSRVLIQARTQYMMENFETMVKNRQENLERSNRDSFMKSEEVSPEPSSNIAAAGSDSQADPRVMASLESVVDKENEAPHSDSESVIEENMDIISEENSSSCGKCTKRRLTEIGQVGEDGSPTKKFKSDEQTPAKESVQISNLLQQFNSGLSGFLSEQDMNKDNNSTSDISSSHGHESLSCSTQIKEAFEALSRPSIALAV